MKKSTILDVADRLDTIIQLGSNLEPAEMERRLVAAIRDLRDAVTDKRIVTCDACGVEQCRETTRSAGYIGRPELRRCKDYKACEASRAKNLSLT